MECDSLIPDSTKTARDYHARSLNDDSVTDWPGWDYHPTRSRQQSQPVGWQQLPNASAPTGSPTTERAIRSCGSPPLNPTISMRMISSVTPPLACHQPQTPIAHRCSILRFIHIVIHHIASPLLCDVRAITTAKTPNMAPSSIASTTPISRTTVFTRTSPPTSTRCSTPHAACWLLI